MPPYGGAAFRLGGRTVRRTAFLTYGEKALPVGVRSPCRARRIAAGDRAGFSLAELLATLVLGGLVSAAIAGTLGGAERLAGAQAARVAAAEALRVASVVLSRELRSVDPAEDIAMLSADSLRLRAFRGTAVVCGLAGSAVYVRYRGLRQPNPAKDSVLALDADGRAQPLALEAARVEAAACPGRPEALVQRWRVGGVVPTGTLLLLFETGSYHLADHAFRYRRGAGGRQPLTAELLDDGASEFRPLGPQDVSTPDPAWAAGIHVPLRVDTARSGSVSFHAPFSSARSRITFLNSARFGPAARAGGKGK